MVIFDRIIRSIQNTGGASILFDEIATRMKRDCADYVEFGYKPSERERSNYYSGVPRLLERYRPAILPDEIDVSTKDIFHSTCYRWPKEKKCLVVTTVYDFTYEVVIKGVRAGVHTLQKNAAISRSDHIICISNSTKDDLLRFVPGAEKKRIDVVHCGATDKYFHLPSVEIKPYVLYVGQRCAYKNFSSLVFALRYLPELELVCVGGGPFTKKEVDLLDSILPGRYTHKGYVSEEQFNLIYNEAFCFAYPSLYEGFGIPVIESMKAGCPVVALNRSSIPEVAGDAAILLEDGSPASLAEGIKQLYSPSLRDSCQKKGLLWSEKFSWERCYRETMAVYQKMGLG